ncbi:6-aminohexanoate hydrolase [Pararhizobium polonicum]|uniref:6-aminohexanoate hydrolase n=1 Tax=Pararhizobium polonicum TaxID=1612624 RepID=A0A1C7P2K3_9HYPH|nr:serine hydrolase [Pararhizobium polonicum]OBZ95490.1 6-aminohexanoate hydrolase [Pararhizobium polonicum]
MNRIALSLALVFSSVPAHAQDGAATTPGAAERLTAVFDRAAQLPSLKSVVVSRDGQIIADRGYGGHTSREPTNIKSASKSVMSALVGIAIAKGELEGVDQKIAPILSRDLPDDPDPRLAQVTVGNLLSMQAGLERTSGPNYGRWVSSRNWVRSALSAPFEAEPGGPMLYSTGSTHLLSAILTRASGQSTLALARSWFEPLKDFSITAWDRDPQGIYLGGNQMAMSTRSLLAFGELYRNGGKTPEGVQIVPADWIAQSWQHRTNSRFTGDSYGYGWFLRTMAGRDVRYAWGYGGQMLYIVPSLGLTVAMTSQEDAPSARTGYRDSLHQLMTDIILASETGTADRPG